MSLHHYWRVTPSIHRTASLIWAPCNPLSLGLQFFESFQTLAIAWQGVFRASAETPAKKTRRAGCFARCARTGKARPKLWPRSKVRKRKCRGWRPHVRSRSRMCFSFVPFWATLAKRGALSQVHGGKGARQGSLCGPSRLIPTKWWSFLRCPFKTAQNGLPSKREPLISPACAARW